jgi:two-component system response regulator RegX3
LIIDDEVELADSTAEYFNMFDIKSCAVYTAQDALDFFKDNTTKLILLDINLGKTSGFELCKTLRKEYDIPILFISARTSDDDVLIALNIGGDDYIKKPYTLNILLAKVKAVLDRYEKAKEAARAAAVYGDGGTSSNTGTSNSVNEEDGRIVIRDGIYLDTAMHKLVVNEKAEELRAMEYKLLLYLLENSGRVITRDELLDNVWCDENTCDGTITVHIRHLREKIETDSKNPAIIKTVWGVGYVVENLP